MKRFFTILSPNNDENLYLLDNDSLEHIMNENGENITHITLNPFHKNSFVSPVKIAEKRTINDFIHVINYGYPKPGAPASNFKVDPNIKEIMFNDINQMNYFITQGKNRIVEWYLDFGINPNIQDQHGNRSLLYVKDFLLLKKLIKSGADMNLVHDGDPIFFYILDNFNEAIFVVKFLLKCGLNLFLNDENGFHYLYRTNKIEIHRLFMKYGLDVKNIRANNGLTLCESYKRGLDKENMFNDDFYFLWISGSRR